MGRFGDPRTSPNVILDLGTGKPLPAYEGLKYHTNAFIDSPDRMRLPTDNRLTNFQYSNKSTQDATYDIVKDALKLRNNHGDDYSLKIGKRPEGMEFAQALSMPYINLSENHLGFYIPKKYDDFAEDEQRKLLKVVPDDATIKPSIDDTLRRNLKTVPPYYVENLNSKAINGQPMDFIKGEGKDLTEFSKNNGYSDYFGSTVRPDYKEDIGQKVRPRDFDSIVKQMHSGKTVSNINLRQLDSFKAKQLLGVYGGNVGGSSGGSSDSAMTEYHRMMKRQYKH